MFFMFFGLFWGGLPTVVVLIEVIQGDAPATIILPVLLFTIIGGIMFTFGLKSVLRQIRLRKIAKNGKETLATFVNQEVLNISNTGTCNYKIIFSYKNDNNEEVERKTIDVYSQDEVNFFAKIGKFNIKYDDKYAIITQEVDYRLLYEKSDLINNDKKLENENSNKNITNYYVCDYCKNIQTKMGKCKSCGAMVQKKSKKNNY